MTDDQKRTAAVAAMLVGKTITDVEVRTHEANLSAQREELRLELMGGDGPSTVRLETWDTEDYCSGFAVRAD